MGEQTMITRRTTLTAGLASVVAGRFSHATAADTPGVTATEIKIGNTMPYSGPASSYSVIGRTEAAFFKMVNEQGGVAGRQINFISLDDGYSPPKTVEDVRRLVEEDQVAFCFQNLGTPCNSAIASYLNHKKRLFDVSSGKTPVEQVTDRRSDQIDDAREGCGVSIPPGTCPGGLEQAIECLQPGV